MKVSATWKREERGTSPDADMFARNQATIYWEPSSSHTPQVVRKRPHFLFC